MYLLKNFYILNPQAHSGSASAKHPMPPKAAQIAGPGGALPPPAWRAPRPAGEALGEPPEASGEYKGFDFYKGSLLVKEGKIAALYRDGHQAPGPETDGCQIIDGRFNRLIFPGFIQCHIHFCQTLHRNLAEQMPLIQWLKQEIWPYEAALTPTTMGRSVMMTLKEILASGTTAALDMGTVHHQEVIFDIMKKTGFRYTGGKAMMDKCEGAPQGLMETLHASIRKSMDLAATYHGSQNGLIHYALSPRFVLSCSIKLLQEVRRISDKENLIIHSHASEHPEEVAHIKKTTGYGNIAYLDHIGALNQHSVFAHMVHLDPDEKKIVKKYNLSSVHCPTTNLKLGSGVAPICEYLNKGFKVGLGCDGAPCNNSLSIFNELKLISLLQNGTTNDPLAVSPEQALQAVTIQGAQILRQQDRIGQLKKGMDADLLLLHMDTPQTYNFQKNPTAAIVYGADARNVAATMVRGKFLYKDGRFSPEIEELDMFYQG